MNSLPARYIYLLLLIFAVGVVVYVRSLPSEEEVASIGVLQEKAKRLEPLHQPMGPTRPGDWLESHKEAGQTFKQYSRSRHIRLSSERNVLYVLPLGEFDENRMKIVDLSADFLGRYFQCSVKTLPVQSLDVIPQKARRVHSSWGVRQIKSTFVLNELLPEMLPEDAVALIAFTSSDLYPADDWNFVFGQASLRQRVGVWSLFRNGDPDVEFDMVLRRTLKTATHETGHMFSIQHCVAYDCNMCGSNNREESDRRSLLLCPECCPKVWLATECDPVFRFDALAEFCETNGLAKEGEAYRRAIKVLK